MSRRWTWRVPCRDLAVGRLLGDLFVCTRSIPVLAVALIFLAGCDNSETTQVHQGPANRAQNMSHPDLATYEVDDTWGVSESMFDKMPMIVRIRQNLRSLTGHPKLPNRLRIVWEYESDNDSGLPSSAVLERMDICENALVGAFERDNVAILTHVLTSDGLRQWVFYASDVQECDNRLNDALPHDLPMPIEMTVDPDAPWTEYTETLGALGL